MTINRSTLSFSKLPAVLKDWMEHPSKMGCLGMIAAPGIGKTAVWRQAVQALKKRECYFNAGAMTLGDLMGCGTPNKEFTHTVFLPHVNFDPAGEILVDELSNAPDRSVFTGLSNLLVEGYLPGHPFRMSGSRTFACNPDHASELAEPLPRIIVSRSVLFDILYTAETDFMPHALKDGINEFHPVVTAFIADTQDAYLQVRDFTPDRLNGVELPPPGTPYPCPRSYELLSDRLYRMERGIGTTVFEESCASVGSEAGKAFSDFYATAKYLPRITDILKQNNPDFPEAAVHEGVVLGPLQMMLAINLLTATSDRNSLEHASEWLLHKVKAGVIGNETLRSFMTYAKDTRHAIYQYDVINAIGNKVLGSAKWNAFLLQNLRANTEARTI